MQKEAMPQSFPLSASVHQNGVATVTCSLARPLQYTLVFVMEIQTKLD